MRGSLALVRYILSADFLDECDEDLRLHRDLSMSSVQIKSKITADLIARDRFEFSFKFLAKSKIWANVSQ